MTLLVIELAISDAICGEPPRDYGYSIDGLLYRDTYNAVAAMLRETGHDD